MSYDNGKMFQYVSGKVAILPLQYAKSKGDNQDFVETKYSALYFDPDIDKELRDKFVKEYMDYYENGEYR